MSTTAVLVEHLICGLQVAAGLILIVLSVFGDDWINLATLEGYATELGLIGLALAYPMGVFVDELADTLLTPAAAAIRRRRFRLDDVGVEPGDARASAFHLLQEVENEFLQSYFSYVRSRIRISRSSMLGFVAVTAGAMAFAGLRAGAGSGVLVSLGVFGAALTALAAWSWVRLTDNFYHRIGRVYTSLGYGS